MILLYPAVLVAAVWIARRSPNHGRGPLWFGAWTLAGALFLFSLATGFSIGLLILPLAAAAVLWAAWRAPQRLEAAGFFVGCAGIVALLVVLNT